MEKKKRRIRFDKIFIFLFCVSLITFIVLGLTVIKVKNIIIEGNDYVSDQEIIESSGLSSYPATLKCMSFIIKKNLKSNRFIYNVEVKKELTSVTIKVEENRPLFYYDSTKQTVLLDGTSIDTKYTVPTVLNYITDDYYESFIKEMGLLNKEVLARISEIEFKPSEVDDNRFLLSMTDGNYIFVNIDTFEKVNKYLSILESLPDKNGILYLDYGNNFEIIQ